MIICSNCGAINSDENSRFCRKCGALLPVMSKPSRIRIPAPDLTTQDKRIEASTINDTTVNSTKNKEVSQNIPYLNREAGLFTPKTKNQDKPSQLELQEIPKPPIQQKLPEQSEIPPKIITTENLKSDLTQIPMETSESGETARKEFLREITPKPFDGTILNSKSTYGPLKKEIEKKSGNETKPSLIKTGDSILKQRQLERDMTDVLTVLSKKLSISREEIYKAKPPKNQEAEKEIVPASMNEILTQLLNLDKFIEASALVKRDGTILASALSSRISDSLFLTIGQNLSMIGTDIIEGLSAGKLSSISIRGTEGVFDLAPVDKKIPELSDMILMIFSHSRVKPGIISFAVNMVKKQIKEYLGIK